MLENIDAFNEILTESIHDDIYRPKSEPLDEDHVLDLADDEVYCYV